MIFFALLLLFATMFLLFESKRLYVHQFPADSENLALPPIIFFSIYMGTVKYKFFELTLESMRWNPKVQFVLINVIDDNSDQAIETSKTVEKMAVPNFKLHIISMVILKMIVH
jgi:hypothetical protein